MDYLDFDLEVQPGNSGAYDVSVVNSPAGEAHAEMTFPYDRLALQNKIQALQIALLRSGGTRRAASTEDKSVEELGSNLFTSLFKGEVGSRLDVSRSIAQSDGKGVRIKLRITPPELAGLPWEYLYDATRGDYLALGTSTPVVRYLPIAQPIQPLEVTPPLRILAMTAGPSDLGELDVTRERQRLETALEKVRQKGLVEVQWVPGETWEDLQQTLWDGPWHIFHYVGHGGFSERLQSGVIYLTGEDGKARELSAKDLAVLLGDHEPLRLALLNSCETAQGAQTDIFSSTAAALVRRGTPAVVAMQFEITDDAAIQFSRVFYTAIARGMPVDSAVAEARKSVALQVANTYEWGTPVLFMRSPDGMLFNLPKTVLAAAPPIEAVVAAPAGGDAPAGAATESSAVGTDGAAPLGEAAATGVVGGVADAANGPPPAGGGPPATAAVTSGGAPSGSQSSPGVAAPTDLGGLKAQWDANKETIGKVAVAGLIAVVAAAVLYMLAGALPPGVDGSPSPLISVESKPTPFAATAQSSFSLDIRVEPPTAKIGDMVTIYLTNFPPNAPVVIEWESGDFIANGETDQYGAFTSEPYRVQRLRAGLKTMYAYAYKDVLGREQKDNIYYNVLATPAPPATLNPPITPSPL
jgi:CHAT domain